MFGISLTIHKWEKLNLDYFILPRGRIHLNGLDREFSKQLKLAGQKYNHNVRSDNHYKSKYNALPMQKSDFIQTKGNISGVKSLRSVNYRYLVTNKIKTGKGG